MTGSVTYGAALRGEWPLDPAVTYLNHGGYGATPSAVLAAQLEWRDRIERNPTSFLSRELPAALRNAASEVGSALGARGEDIVFVANATSGINAVLRSLAFAPDDEILIVSLAYPAIRKAARFAAEKSGARLVEAALTLPLRDAASGARRDGGAARAPHAARHHRPHHRGKRARPAGGGAGGRGA